MWLPQEMEVRSMWPVINSLAAFLGFVLKDEGRDWFHVEAFGFPPHWP